MASTSKLGSALLNPDRLFLCHMAPENNRQAPCIFSWGGTGASAAGDTISGAPSGYTGTYPPINSAIACEDADPGALDFVTPSWWLQPRGRKGGIMEVAYGLQAKGHAMASLPVLLACCVNTI